MARKTRNPSRRGWYEKAGDPPGTERFWDGTKWGPNPRQKRGAAAATAAKATRSRAKQAVEPDAADAADEDGEAASRPTLEQSSVWARISARSADMLVMLLPWYFLWIRAFDTQEIVDAEGVVTTITETNPVFLWLAPLVVVIYEVVFVGWWGATPGKRLVGLVIVDAESLERPTWGRAVLRSTPLFLVAAIVLAPALWLLSVITMARSKTQRSLFDFSGGTFVILDPERPGRLARPKR